MLLIFMHVCVSEIERESIDNYNRVNNRRNCYNPEASGVSIGDEGTDQRGQASSAVEVGDGVGCFG